MEKSILDTYRNKERGSLSYFKACREGILCFFRSPIDLDCDDNFFNILFLQNTGQKKNVKLVRIATPILTTLCVTRTNVFVRLGIISLWPTLLVYKVTSLFSNCSCDHYTYCS